MYFMAIDADEGIFYWYRIDNSYRKTCLLLAVS